eukprot:1138208-Pelagomonas_calceolata.AAC.11
MSHTSYEGGPHVALIACAILRARARLSWSVLAACLFLTAPRVSCPGAAAPGARGGWCWCLNVRRLRPGFAIAGAAVVTELARTALAFGGAFDAVGACAAGTAAAAAAAAAAVCVGGKAANAAAADGGVNYGADG